MRKNYLKIINDIKSCERCRLCKDRTQTVSGTGSWKPKVLFLGEAPGFNEDRLGHCFVGRSGKLLRQSLAEVGFKSKNFYIDNLVKCRPPNNRKPREDEKRSCYKHLFDQLIYFKPKIIVSLGKETATFLLEYWGHDSTVRWNKLYKVEGYFFVPVYHPSYILRNFGKIDEFLDGLKFAKKLAEGD